MEEPSSLSSNILFFERTRGATHSTAENHAHETWQNAPCWHGVSGRKIYPFEACLRYCGLTGTNTILTYLFPAQTQLHARILASRALFLLADAFRHLAVTGLPPHVIYPKQYAYLHTHTHCIDFWRVPPPAISGLLFSCRLLSTDAKSRACAGPRQSHPDFLKQISRKGQIFDCFMRSTMQIPFCAKTIRPRRARTCGGGALLSMPAPSSCVQKSPIQHRFLACAADALGWANSCEGCAASHEVDLERN